MTLKVIRLIRVILIVLVIIFIPFIVGRLVVLDYIFKEKVQPDFLAWLLGLIFLVIVAVVIGMIGKIMIYIRDYIIDGDY